MRHQLDSLVDAELTGFGAYILRDGADWAVHMDSNSSPVRCIFRRLHCCTRVFLSLSLSFYSLQYSFFFSPLYKINIYLLSETHACRRSKQESMPNLVSINFACMPYWFVSVWYIYGTKVVAIRTYADMLLLVLLYRWEKSSNALGNGVEQGVEWLDGHGPAGTEAAERG